MASLNGSNGFQLIGTLLGEQSGVSEATGDVNGDGISDIIIGAPSGSPNGVSNAGSAYVVYGHSSAWSASYDLTSPYPINGTNGFALYGAAANDQVGESVATGDINGDGIADIIMGAYGAGGNGSPPDGPTNYGAVYAVFGKSGSRASAYMLGSSGAFSLTGILDGTNGFELDGANAGDWAGYAVATGDVNGDGKPDVVIGAIYAGPGGNTQAGSTYVYYGQKQSVWTTPYNLSGLCSGVGC